MKIILVAAISIDGKITRGADSDVSKWTSAEDADHFANLRASRNLLVMGRKTYEAMRPKIRLSSGKLRVVLTNSPESYKAETVNGQLEFSNESPTVLIGKLEDQGYSEMLLLGGGQIHSLFITAGLVDEIYLTVEPKLFGKGTDFAAGIQPDMSLKLLSIKQLNSRGTLLAHYKILKNKS